VIDREGGQQPMVSADGSLVIVFNGEIYDHAVLREELVQRGHRFHTRSDTEVILEAYRAWGEECLARLHGMFAFVLFDRTRRKLFAARDRFGKKPLYYFQSSSPEVRFAFASEVSALRELPSVRSGTSIDPNGVVSYLLHDGVLAPRSIWKGIFQLPPGHRLSLELDGSGEPRVACYWDRREACSASSFPSIEEAGEEVLERLDRAVSRRLVADVPLGVFLSGGVDSSAIVALAARHRPAAEILTFSIGFDDPSFDESAWAERVAKSLGTPHHHRLFTSKEMLARFDSVIDSLDEPFADPSILPTAMLSSFAREHVTVALSGEGGDELLAGYDPFRALGPAAWYRRLVPRGLTAWLQTFALNVIPASEANMSLDFKVDRFLRGLAVSEPMQLATWMGSLSLDQLKKLMPSLREGLSAERVFGDVIASFGRTKGSAVDRALDFYQRFYLPDDILRKVDRASMWVGLELRCPFLDTELAEYVNGLPTAMKFHRGETKRVFKEALRRNGLIPREVIDRPKKGFGIPIARWLRTDLRGEVEAHLVADWPWSLSFIDPTRVRDLVRDHFSRRANRAKEIWSLLVLSKWIKKHAG
jgi:asparagine synthase (glutamine-hydrolysing)